MENRAGQQYRDCIDTVGGMVAVAALNRASERRYGAMQRVVLNTQLFHYIIMQPLN